LSACFQDFRVEQKCRTQDAQRPGRRGAAHCAGAKQRQVRTEEEGLAMGRAAAARTGRGPRAEQGGSADGAAGVSRRRSVRNGSGPLNTRAIACEVCRRFQISWASHAFFPAVCLRPTGDGPIVRPLPPKRHRPTLSLSSRTSSCPAGLAARWPISVGTQTQPTAAPAPASAPALLPSPSLAVSRSSLSPL
jgi:hypothetical protein